MSDDGPLCETCGDPLEGVDGRLVVPSIEGETAVLREFCGKECLPEDRR